MTKQVRISDVHFQMLVDVGKRWRMKPDELVEELIQETHGIRKAIFVPDAVLKKDAIARSPRLCEPAVDSPEMLNRRNVRTNKRGAPSGSWRWGESPYATP